MSNNRVIKTAKRLKKKANLAAKKTRQKIVKDVSAANLVNSLFDRQNSTMTKEYIVQEMLSGDIGSITKEGALMFFDCMEKEHSLEFDLINPKPVTMSISKSRPGRFKSTPSSWFTSFGKGMADKYGKEEGGRMTGDINLAYMTLMNESHVLLN